MIVSAASLFQKSVRHIAVLIALCGGLSACLYHIESDQQIYGESDLDEIGTVQWKVLTSIGGNLPQGRTTNVTEEGRVEVAELSEDRLVASDYEDGVLLSQMAITRHDSKTARLSMFEAGDSPETREEQTCLFGVVGLTDDLFVVPSIGKCDDEFAHYFFARSDDPETNGFVLLGFDTKKVPQIKASVDVHRIAIKATTTEIVAQGDIDPKVFSRFVKDLHSAGLLN